MVFQGKILDLTDGPVETAVVEWLSGTPRAFRFAIGTQGVILGSAPGCDIRLGANNPPLLAFLQYVHGTLFVRSLSPQATLKLQSKSDPGVPEPDRRIEGEAFLSQGDTFALLEQKGLVLLIGPPGEEKKTELQKAPSKILAQVEPVPSPIEVSWEPYLNQIEEEAQKIRHRQDELVSLSEALESQAKAIDWWHQNLSAHEANLVEQKRVLEEKQKEIEQREKLLFETFQSPQDVEQSQTNQFPSRVLYPEKDLSEEPVEWAQPSFSEAVPEVLQTPQKTTTFEETSPLNSGLLNEISGNGILPSEFEEIPSSHHALAELESPGVEWPEDDSWDFLSQSAEPTATVEVVLPSHDNAVSAVSPDEPSPNVNEKLLLEGSFKEDDRFDFHAGPKLSEPLNQEELEPKFAEKENDGFTPENEESVVSVAPLFQIEETETLNETRELTTPESVEEIQVSQPQVAHPQIESGQPEIPITHPVLVPTVLPSLEPLSAQKNWFLPHSFEEWFLAEFLGLDPSSIEQMLLSPGLDASLTRTDAEPLRILNDQGWLRPHVIQGLNALASAEGISFTHWLESRHPGINSWCVAISSHLGNWFVHPYLIVEKVPSVGPWGETLKAIHTDDGSKVFLLAKPESESAGEIELASTWQTLIDLDHENIVPYLGTLEFLGKTWGIWQEPHGRVLGEHTRISPALGIWYRLFLQATLGLRALHQQGLTHGALSARQFLLQPSGILTFCHPLDLGNVNDLGKVKGLGGRSDIGGQILSSLRSQKDLSDLGSIGWQWLTRMFGEHDREDWKKWIPQSLWELLNRLDPQTEVFPKILSSDELANQLDRLGLQIRSNPYSWASFLDRQFPGRQNQNGEPRRISA